MMDDHRESREVVGDLSASQGHNAERKTGEESTSGISEALKRFSESKEADSDGEPYPAMLAAGANTRELPQLRCPLDGCDYQHDSSQGLAGHVGNANGHGWDSVDVVAADLHELASRGEHPEMQVRELLVGNADARKAITAAKHVERVRQWCRRNVPIWIGRIQVYVHPARKRVEVATRTHLDSDEFNAFRKAMKGSDTFGYDGRSCVNYCRPNRIESLPATESESRT